MLSLNDLEKYFPESVKGFKENILREYVQCKILEIIFDSKIADSLSFIGGTALRIIYGTSRFSEDIDFDNFNLLEKDFFEVSELVKSRLELEGFNVEIQTASKHNTYHYFIKFPSLLYQNKLSAHITEKILVKVDTQAQEFSYTPEKKLLKKFDVLTQINVTPIDVLLSMKINAIFNRKRVQGRDFYDIAFICNKTKPNYDFLKQKLDISNPRQLKDKLLKKCEELDFNKLEKDVEPLIFNQNELKKIVLFKDLIREIEL